ncbi:MAG: tol-pal system YbgF family protein [Muribaculaceae bacterium]
MTADFENIEQLLRDSKPDEAIALLDAYVADSASCRLDTAYFLLGNAYRQKGDWRMAINSYNRSVQINPDGQAATALQAANEVLDFFNHDLYNP